MQEKKHMISDKSSPCF